MTKQSEGAYQNFLVYNNYDTGHPRQLLTALLGEAIVSSGVSPEQAAACI
ncbi:hypothetical protein [Arenibacter sp. H213]|uniref:Uncharacterized protein n=1 Tax=Arenibacter antarcticus TaxID=2040469 RepID=A0ABW5VHD1_9FLAO|nr:hypothetical protein [Arenibacter sp. H213]